MNDHEADGRTELVAELARLETGNARLRSLLGLDDRSADGHATAWIGIYPLLRTQDPEATVGDRR